jgi:bifunctional DNA-binding transcriptional regulator/antitoxin component of YhaV-PrlF toxin-antitoxin module
MGTSHRTRHRSTHRIRLAAGGRLAVPARVWRRLGIRPGDELILVSDESGFRVTTLEQAAREVEAFLSGLDSGAESPSGAAGRPEGAGPAGRDDDG